MTPDLEYIVIQYCRQFSALTENKVASDLEFTSGYRRNAYGLDWYGLRCWQRRAADLDDSANLYAAVDGCTL